MDGAIGRGGAMAETDKETDEWGITAYLMCAEMMQRYSSAELTAGGWWVDEGNGGEERRGERGGWKYD